MSIDPSVFIAVLSGVVGALVGALSQHLGFFFQTYREDKRILKRVLYNQLDLWVELKYADVSSNFPLLMKTLKDELIRRGADAGAVNSLVTDLPDTIMPVLKSTTFGDPSKILPRYQASVDDLASAAPILAHRLSGKIDEDFKNSLKKIVEKAKAFVPPKEFNEQAPAVRQLVSISEDKQLLNTIDSVKDDIKSVAWRIHWWTRLVIWREFRRKERLLQEKAVKGANDMIDSLMAIQPLINTQPKTQKK